MTWHGMLSNSPDPSAHTAQAVGNVVSASAVILAWVGLVTDIIPVFLATLVSIAALIFYGLQIYESPTMRRWRYKRRDHKILLMKARIAGIEARQKLETEFTSTHAK